MSAPTLREALVGLDHEARHVLGALRGTDWSATFPELQRACVEARRALDSDLQARAALAAEERPVQVAERLVNILRGMESRAGDSLEGTAIRGLRAKADIVLAGLEGDAICAARLRTWPEEPAAPPASEGPERVHVESECSSCAEEPTEGVARFEWPKSQRPCGHHCNHSWTHDACCWCGWEFDEGDEEPAPAGDERRRELEAEYGLSRRPAPPAAAPSELREAAVISKRREREGGQVETVHYFVGPARATKAEAAVDRDYWSLRALAAAPPPEPQKATAAGDAACHCPYCGCSTAPPEPEAGGTEGWVPVSERLPERGTYNLLAACGTAVVADVAYNCPAGTWGFHLGELELDVTHWRPLPAPPEGG